ncbi:MAG: hypothetical protein LBE49_06485, partial [Deltaproteobacteria bacterium]|nr:hypothetical protein [Deltaproteobacteria bacterium]
MRYNTSDRSSPPSALAERGRTEYFGEGVLDKSALGLAIALACALLAAALIVGSLSARPASADEAYWDGPGLPPFTVFPEPGPSGQWFYPGPATSGNKLTLLSTAPVVMAAGGYFLTLDGGVEGEASGNLVTVIGDGPETFRLLKVVGGVVQAGAKTGYRASQKVVFRADGNTVIVKGADVAYDNGGLVIGGQGVLLGHGWASANRNVVVFEGGWTGIIIGGYNYHQPGYGDPIAPDDYSETSYNQILVKDSIVAGYVTGGTSNVNLAVGKSVHNLLTLEGAVEIGAGLYGGQTSKDPLGEGWDYYTGNVLTLRLPAAGGMKVGNQVDQGTVKNFESFRFELDPSTLSDFPVLDAFVDIYLHESGGERISRIESLDMAVDKLPEPGQRLLLFRAPDIYDGGFEQTRAQGAKGLGLVLDFDLELVQDSALPDTLTAVFKGARSHPRMAALPDGRSAGLALLTQGQDHLAGQGLGAALGRPLQSRCPAVFSTVEASIIKFGRPGDNRLRSLQALLGIDCTSFLEAGSLTMGGFFELGRGSYETATLQPAGGRIEGEGRTSYAGIGALARFDFGGSGLGKSYLEATVRTGELRLDYETGDFLSEPGLISFKTRGHYLGGHVAAGRVIRLNSANTL